MTKPARWSGALGVAAFAIALHARDLGRPLGGDDIYVLESLRSASWWRRLFAFDVDAPGADYWPWWTGVVVQRRFIRVPSSALLWLESHLFGPSPAAFSTVTLTLVVASCLLIYAESARWLVWWKAAMLALVPALHPATSEVIELMNRQPLATSGFFCIVSATAWIRMRERFSPTSALVALTAGVLAVSAYEAAIALPFALVLGDLCFPDGEGNHTLRLRWGPRLAALAVAAAYLPFAATIRHGLVTPDTTHLRPLAEVARALRFDSVAYALKALGVFNPLEPTSYWLQRTAGEPIAWVVCLAAAVVFGMARGLRLGMRPLGWFGLATFALFLAPPLLTRASVSIWNLPTLRQLYLPVLLGGPLLMAAWLQSGSASPSAGRRLRAVAAFAWLALLAVQSALSTGHFGSEGDAAGVARVTAALLDGVPPNATVVGIGEETCRFAPSLIRGGPSILAVPAGRDEADPELDAVGQHTVIARASNGFDIPAREEPPERAPGPGPGPSWITLRPPQLLGTGSQRIPGATVTVAQRDGERITSLRYDFDSPLEDLVFLRFHGCERPTREVVRPADGLP